MWRILLLLISFFAIGYIFYRLILIIKFDEIHDPNLKRFAEWRQRRKDAGLQKKT